MKDKGVRTKLRRIRRIALLVASLLLCLIPHIFCKTIRLPSRWPQRFLALAARSIGARTAIEGTPRSHDIFFIANHISWLDILVLGGATGTAFISHDGVADWPLVGWLARQNNTIFVARTDRRGVRDQIATLRTALEGHQPVAIFPEGTTSDGRSLLPFKAALLAGLMPPPRNLDIQPVWIDYGAATEEIAWHGNEPARVNAKRILGRKGPLRIILHFLDPFDPEHMPDRKAVADEARNRIMARQSAFAPPSGPV